MHGKPRAVVLTWSCRHLFLLLEVHDKAKAKFEVGQRRIEEAQANASKTIEEAQVKAKAKFEQVQGYSQCEREASIQVPRVGSGIMF